MHERTQRAIARLMFVFCCAVPTMFTMAIVLVMATPWYAGRVRRAAEAEWSRATGLVVQIDDYRRIAPSTIRIDGLTLTEPETGREVARVAQVQWVTTSSEVAIVMQQPELQSRELESLWQLVHDRFLCRPEQTRLPVTLAANDLTIHSLSAPMTLRDVDAVIEPLADSVAASVQCLPAISTTGTPINITVTRDRSGPEPVTRWMLDTQNTALPCSVLAEYLPAAMGNLGIDAMFNGTMQWQATADDWWVNLSGSRFERVQLDRVFEKQMHRLTGLASIQLDRCMVRPGKRLDVTGYVRARDGLIGRPLLFALQQNLGLDVLVPEGNEDIAYDRIAMRFSIDDTILRLDGECRKEVGYESYPVGVALCAGGYPLVRSTGQSIPAIAIGAVLAPSHAIAVPLSGQNRWLTNILIPPSRPLAENVKPPRPRIQTADRYQGGPLTGQPY